MTWQAKLEIVTRDVKLLVTNGADDVLKARLPGVSDHPRALLTILEGLALFQGKALCCVISAANPVDHSLGLGVFDDDLWPRESALVRFEFVESRRRPRRIAGLGSYRRLRSLEGAGK